MWLQRTDSIRTGLYGWVRLMSHEPLAGCAELQVAHRSKHLPEPGIGDGTYWADMRWYVFLFWKRTGCSVILRSAMHHGAWRNSCSISACSSLRPISNWL